MRKSRVIADIATEYRPVIVQRVLKPGRIGSYTDHIGLAIFGPQCASAHISIANAIHVANDHGADKPGRAQPVVFSAIRIGVSRNVRKGTNLQLILIIHERSVGRSVAF